MPDFHTYFEGSYDEGNRDTTLFTVTLTGPATNVMISIKGMSNDTKTITPPSTDTSYILQFDEKSIVSTKVGAKDEDPIFRSTVTDNQWSYIINPGDSGRGGQLFLSIIVRYTLDADVPIVR